MYKQGTGMLRAVGVSMLGLILSGNVQSDAVSDRANVRSKPFGEVLPRQNTSGLSATTLDALRNTSRELVKERHGACILLYGAAGTGKSQAAGFIGGAVRQHIYRVDLAAVESKYIGETEKNLERVMEQAEKNDWILLFDEADALFGKRKQVPDAQDRYANIPTSYLLERLAHYRVYWILTTNLQDKLSPDVLARCRYQIKVD